jgi:hypothetical protein
MHEGIRRLLRRGFRITFHVLLVKIRGIFIAVFLRIRTDLEILTHVGRI